MDDMQIDEDPGPTELNTSMHGPGLELGKDRLSARYVGDARHNNDVGAIQANRSIPLHTRLFYFEVTITSALDAPHVAIGFTEKNFKLTRQPGWEAGSYGYMSETGGAYGGSDKGEEYGPRYGAGDTVGAGLHLGRQEIFFTKNGTKLKTAFRNVARVLFPTLSLHSTGASVLVNFGAKPFEFDLEGLLAEERGQQQAALDSMDLPPAALHAVVRDYLLHAGYGATLGALDVGAGLEAPAAAPGSAAAAAADTLQMRQALRGALLAGEVGVAQALLQERCGGLLGGTCGGTASTSSSSSSSSASGWGRQVGFHLACQHFIELIRQGRVTEAVAHGQTALGAARAAYPPGEGLLREVVALLAYERPQDSCLAHLLAPGQRAAVADVVNAAVLAAAAEAAAAAAVDPSGRQPAGSSGGKQAAGGNPAAAAGGGGEGGGEGMLGLGQQQAPASSCWDTPVKSVLERLLQQLGAVQGLLREANANQGEVFRLQDYLGDRPGLP